MYFFGKELNGDSVKISLTIFWDLYPKKTGKK